MAHRNPGLDAREKLTPVKTESKMVAPNLHGLMMGRLAPQVKPRQINPIARRLR